LWLGPTRAETAPARKGVDHESSLDERERVTRERRNDGRSEDDAVGLERGGREDGERIGGDAATGHPRALDARPFGGDDAFDDGRHVGAGDVDANEQVLHHWPPFSMHRDASVTLGRNPARPPTAPFETSD
jgi:hypothetical protein